MAYVQDLHHNEPRQYIATSLFDALKSFGSATKEKKVRNERFKKIYSDIEEFIELRNRTIHSYVIVDGVEPLNFQGRENVSRMTAQLGYKTLRETMKYTSTQTRLMKKVATPEELKNELIEVIDNMNDKELNDVWENIQTMNKNEK